MEHARAVRGSHSPRNKVACIFFVKGNCSKADKCPFIHSFDTLESTVLCRYHLLGTCRYGEYCQLTHGNLCPHCNTNALHPFSQKQADQHIRMCAKKVFMLNSLPKELIDISKKIECGICLEIIMDKGCRFGLMTGCEHGFCLGCIRNWRNKSLDMNNTSEMIKACPTCRQDSLFILPSLVYMHGELKEQMVVQYKINLKKKACKYYTCRGVCPFGGDCFYAHLNKEGNPVDSSLMINVFKTRQDMSSALDMPDLMHFFSQLSVQPQYVLEILMSIFEETEWED